MARPSIQRPLSSQLDRRFQIKLLDLCTEHQSVYYQSEPLSEFWDNIADALGKQGKHVRFPLTGKDVEAWVEGICLEAKVHLTQGVAFPRRAGREDLDIAIEDWLEVEGRRKLQKGASEMRMGYIFAFGPEKSDEEHLLAEPCLHRLRDNADKIKTAVSEKGKAIHKTKIRLVQHVETTLAPKPPQKPLTAAQFSGSGNGVSEKLPPVLNSESNNTTTCCLDQNEIDDIGIGPSDAGEAATQKSPSILPEALSERYDSPYLSVGPSPARGPSPILGALNTPIKTPASAKRANTNKQKNTPRPAQQRHADVNTSKWLCSSPSAARKHVLQASATKSKKSPARSRTNADSPRGLVRMNSSNANSRNTSPSPPSRNTAIAASNSNTQDQQQAEDGGRSVSSPRQVRQEPRQSFAAVVPVTSKKGKNKRSSSQVNTPNKVHRTRYQMSSPLPIGKSPLEDVTHCDDVGYPAPSMTPPSDPIQEPQAPSTERSRSELRIQDDEPARSSPSVIPIIDLTQSPSRNQVKKEEEQDGLVFGNLGGRLISQLTTNLHGAVGLTEHIKEIVGRTISQSLEEFERRAMGRLDDIRSDVRALEDSRNHS